MVGPGRADIEGVVSLVPSLLQAIVRIDGEALVMHVGDKPYVVSPTGQVDLATRGLTFDAVSGIVNQLLPPESQRALDEFGAAQFELPPVPEFPGEHFTVVVARGGDDVWAEIRRRRISGENRVPVDVFGTLRGGAGSGHSNVHDAAPTSGYDAVRETAAIPDSGLVHHAAGPAVETDSDDLRLPGAEELWPGQIAPPGENVETHESELTPSPRVFGTAPPSLQTPAVQNVSGPSSLEFHGDQLTPVELLQSPVNPDAPLVVQAAAAPERPAPVLPPPAQVAPSPVASEQPPPKPVVRPVNAAAALPNAQAPVSPALATVVPPPVAAGPHAMPPVPGRASAEAIASGLPPTFEHPSSEAFAPAAPEAFAPGAHVSDPASVETFAHSAPAPSPFTPQPQPAVVLPMARNPIRSDVPPPLAEQALAGLDRLLRLAAARGASALYLSSASRPSVRVDGELQTLDGAPVLGPNDVESLLLTLMPERNAEGLRTGGTSEWICDLPDVGRVRCMSFRDYRGMGGVFRMMPVRAVTAEQLGLSREIQSLAIEPEGLVLVAGPRSSGKRTLLSALVDLINRVRRDHVITIEKEINVVHERIGSFISQREVHGGNDELLVVAHAALREDPDVLVLEELGSSAVMNLALDAASSGHLVIGGLPAASAAGAIDRIIDLYPPEYRRQVQLSLAQNLRGVVSQVLLRKTGGGRLAAREVLINTPAVRSILAEGKTSQLPLAIEGGRAQGMVPLNDWLVGYVQSGAVDGREAYRRAVDRTGFLALLKRQGLDTSALERFG